MDTPPFLEAHLRAGKSLFSSGAIGEILFSEGTYQIEIKEKKRGAFWPFLQLSDTGELQDFFCSCSSAEKKKSCPHLAAAYYAIFKGEKAPLHVRFRESLWNVLCNLASRRHGYDAKGLKGNQKSGYLAVSGSGKEIFSIKALNEKAKGKLNEILFHRVLETEETSLKFSNLPEEELLLWKEGRPSHHLLYELSFWSDLAKWLMLLQEEKKSYAVRFIGEKEALPKTVEIAFKEIVSSFYIAGVNWESVIPALATVSSPLSVFEFEQEKIEAIHYDPNKQSFQFIFSSLELKKRKQLKQGITVGKWLFVYGEGFFPAHVDPLLQQREIHAVQISTLLQRQFRVVQKYLVGTTLHLEGISARYRLFFDESAHLHIQCYVFEEGDLLRTPSALFGQWAYLDGKGFYLLENLPFDGVEKVIEKARVADFVSRHRHWLHDYPGFETHVASVEPSLSYQVTERKDLLFEARMRLVEEQEEMIDFEEWLYVKERGFFPKAVKKMVSALHAGLRIEREKISSFIHEHKEELEALSGFFSSFSPLEKSGLEISLSENHLLRILPVYSFKKGYVAGRVKLLGNFTYVAGEGFAEIPLEFRIPEKYQKECMVDPELQPTFLAYELEAIWPYILSIDQRLIKPQELHLNVKRVQKDERSQVASWIFELEYESERGAVSPCAIWQAQVAHRRFLFSNAGFLIAVNARFNWLKGISKKRWHEKGNKIRLSTLEWLKISAWEKIREKLYKESARDKSRIYLEQFRTMEVEEKPNLTGLTSVLRSYQEKGVSWLWFLYVQGLSGLLSDEMGLGKTHQAMGLLSSIFNQKKEKGLKFSFLVVCPTSVIFHWQELLGRFLPHFKVSIFYGIQRTLDDFEGNYDLLLTSYGIVRSEKKALAKLFFDVAIFDEIQTAKNVESQTHRALRQIRAKMRLGLTGTPIENRLMELKALFDLVLPSYLPIDTHFKELFVNPIEKNQDEEKRLLLKQLVRPFILRRKKAEVLLELPEKIEEVTYCALSQEQLQLYHEACETAQKKLLGDLEDENRPVPYLHIFALFSKLKQICDHPCLITKKFDDYAVHRSGKWDLFIELLEEIHDSGQKVVVFSQYLDMLDLIERHLSEKGIGFAGIRGDTRDRQQQVRKFYEDPLCEVFVASLQAAGVGIDLVAASVVIHYDRWWNPAKENQATDRVHRMGQTRGVQVFKLVTKNTIEEHIHRLIERKKGLAEEVIGHDDEGQLKMFNRDELKLILRQLQQDLGI